MIRLAIATLLVAGSIAVDQASQSAAAPEWIGKWAFDAKACNEPESSSVIKLTRKQFDLSPFEMECSVLSVQQTGGEYRFKLQCGGEGGPEKVDLKLRVSLNALMFLNGDFDPKGFVRCPN